MKIHWYLPLKLDHEQDLSSSALASIRLRAYPSILGLKAAGHAVSFGDSCDYQANVGAAIIGKLGAPDEVPQRQQSWSREILQLKQNGTKIIFDYTDHHLGINSNMSEFYRKNIRLADFIITPSPRMGELVSEYSACQVFQIPDGIEVKSISPRINHNKIPHGLWFGAKSNLPYLFSFLEKLPVGVEIKLTLLTDQKGIDITRSIAVKTAGKVSVQLALWSLENMITEAMKCDFCVIPSSISDLRKAGAGSNRLMTAFSLGLPVAASRISAYQPFSDYFFDIDSPDLGDFFANPGRWHPIVSEAQRKLVPDYYGENIGIRWASVFDSMFAP